VNASRIVTGLFYLSLVATLAGCSLFSGLFKKDLLEGDPEITGMAVASCEIIANFQDRGFWGTIIGIDKKGSASGGAITGVDGIQLEGIPEDNVVVFQNLQPGQYKLVLMRGTRMLNGDAIKKIYDCPTDWEKENNWPATCPRGVEFEYLLQRNIQDELTFNVTAGELVFIGHLVFDEPHDPPYGNIRKNTAGTSEVDFHQCRPNEKFRLERDPENEINTLERASSSFGDNYWTARINERIKELELEMGEQ